MLKREREVKREGDLMREAEERKQNKNMIMIEKRRNPKYWKKTTEGARFLGSENTIQK